MAVNIYVNVTGNGSAWVDNPTPNLGDTITLECIPNTGETLDDVQATDGNNYPVAVAVQQTQTITLSSSYDYGGSITIDVTFSGTTPPTPTTPRKRKRMPIWMYPCLNR